MAKHEKSHRSRRHANTSNRHRALLAATSLLATSLGVAAGALADGALHVANADKVGGSTISHKHLSGVKYEDVKTTKGTKTPAGATTPQKSTGMKR